MSNTRNLVFLETWLLGLKAKYPAIYDAVRRNDDNAHKFTIVLLSKIDTDHKTHRVAQVLIRLHNCYVTGAFEDSDEELRQFFSNHMVSPLNSIRVAIRYLEETFD